jgi:hypothetical protein
MFLSLSKFIEYQLFRVFGSTNFIHIAVRILRVTIITIGTGSAIYAIKFLPKLREKELSLEEVIKHRLSLEGLIADRTAHDEQLKKEIADLHIEYEHLNDIYIQLESNEKQLSNTMQNFINNQRLLHQLFSIDKNGQEFFSSSDILTTKRIKSTVSQSCLPSRLLSSAFNEVDTMNTIESLQTNTIIMNSIRHRPKKLFARMLWLKKKKHDNSRGDGDTSLSLIN